MTEKKERIAKKMAEAGLCSRREAERWIAAGRVSVNGKVLDTPAFVVGAKDEVFVDGKLLKQKEKTRVWLYHKPVGLVTTHKDPQGRPTVFEKLPKSLPRVISIGRLDLNSEGLLLLTNDGEWARKMELPSSHLERTYRVKVHGNLTGEVLSRLSKGVKIDGIQYAPTKVIAEKKQGTNTWIKMTLTEGKNREIRRLMAFFGLEVAKLIRISYGPYDLGELKPGEVKEVPCALFQE
ncbi:MAG: rRNA pseudouridine synthase [Alphaproteobacteria bacterium]|nr:rRNA pseudouridine synthase [Alphaproteobacteria bacterium]